MFVSHTRGVDWFKKWGCSAGGVKWADGISPPPSSLFDEI